MLIAAALLAGAIGDVKDAAVILAVVLFNSVLGFWQEYRAEADARRAEEDACAGGARAP